MLLGSLALVATNSYAQLKVGERPTKINRASVLELESDRQGLLLPRLTSFTEIDNLTPPEGMVVYYQPTLPAQAKDAGLYVRRNGFWEKMGSDKDATGNWKLTGNDAVAGNFIGTNAGSVPLVLKGQGAEGLIIDNGYAFLRKMDVSVAGLDVLIVDPADGKVSRRKLSESAFKDAIASMNGDATTAQTLTTGDPNTGAARDYYFDHNGAGDHKLQISTQDGTRAVGLLTMADYNTFSKATKIQIGAFNTLATSATGISLDVTGANPVLSLHAATSTTPGGVSAGAQSFGGTKTFVDNIVVNGVGTFGTGLTVTGATTLNDDANLVKGLHVGAASKLDGKVTLGNVSDGALNDYTVLMFGTGGEIIKRVLPQSTFTQQINTINGLKGPDVFINAGNAGKDLNITQDDPSNTVTVNIPTASLVADRGLVSNTAQTFKGDKKFNDEVAVRTRIVVGDTLVAANSTLQVAGSVSMNIVNVSADYTALDTDNTILVDCTGGDRKVTLVAASGRKGRIITIKKIGGSLARSLQIVPAGTEKIEDGTDYFIYNDWTFVTLQTDGANWFIIRK